MKTLNFLLVVLFFALLTNVKGQTRFQKTYGGTGDEMAWHIMQTPDTGYLICGSTTSWGNGGKDAYVIKTDANGNKQWSKTFGGTGDDEATYYDCYGLRFEAHLNDCSALTVFSDGFEVIYNPH